MNLVELTEAIIKRLVADPETVSVKEFDTEEENTVQIEVLIQEDDMGRVIGKNGKVISGIKKYHPKRLILIGGSSTIDSVEDEIYPIVPNVATIEESMSKPIEMLEKLLGTIKL